MAVDKVVHFKRLANHIQFIECGTTSSLTTFEWTRWAEDITCPDCLALRAERMRKLDEVCDSLRALHASHAEGDLDDV